MPALPRSRSRYLVHGKETQKESPPKPDINPTVPIHHSLPSSRLQTRRQLPPFPYPKLHLSQPNSLNRCGCARQRRNVGVGVHIDDTATATVLALVEFADVCAGSAEIGVVHGVGAKTCRPQDLVSKATPPPPKQAGRRKEKEMNHIHCP